MPTFTYGSYSYTYTRERQERKSLALTVYPDMSISLKTPISADDEKVEKFLKRKWFWLNKQLKFFEKFQRKQYDREYVSGESFLYLGRQYKLVVRRGKEEGVKLTKGVLLVKTSHPVRDGEYNKKLLMNWFDQRRAIVFQERFEQMLDRFDYNHVPKLETRKMAKRWGSFLSKEKIILNPKLIHASKDAIDYVIVHELCHLKYKNHDKRFWSFLEQKYPKWQKVKDKLECYCIA